MRRDIAGLPVWIRVSGACSQSREGAFGPKDYPPSGTSYGSRAPNRP